MKKVAVVVGGSGYIGGFLIRDLLARSAFDAIYNLDINPRDFQDARVLYRCVDVRNEIREQIEPHDPSTSWIYNLAALCREPGSEPREYFDTNVGGAERVTDFARRLDLRNILFTSTMSSFGRMEKPTREQDRQYPETPYGISKLVAEKIHQGWLAEKEDRKLIICRPSVIFGPGDNQNVPRLIRTIRKGLMIFPGDPAIVKAYGYVIGLVESMAFAIDRTAKGELIYHYAEKDCLTLQGMVEAIAEFMGKKPLVLRIPSGPVVLAAAVIQAITAALGRKSPIHPVRIRKLAFPTNLKPQYLIDSGFEFKYTLPMALVDWKKRAPEDWDK